MRRAGAGSMTRLGAVLAGALAALALAAPGASAGAPRAQAAGTGPCPTFQVLHNDRIGPAVFPKGTYAIKLLIPNFSCANASKRFTQFLKDFDGKLPPPWGVVSKGTGIAVFTRSGRAAFRAKRIGPGGGGGGGKKPATCPGNFRVLKNSQIGRLIFPKGRYRLIIPVGSIISCQQAAKLFGQFLNHPSGNLPKNWRVKPATALFFKPGNAKRKKFRVDPGL
jgi:hypothetical protein